MFKSTNFPISSNPKSKIFTTILDSSSGHICRTDRVSTTVRTLPQLSVSMFHIPLPLLGTSPPPLLKGTKGQRTRDHCHETFHGYSTISRLQSTNATSHQCHKPPMPQATNAISHHCHSPMSRPESRVRNSLPSALS